MDQAGHQRAVREAVARGKSDEIVGAFVDAWRADVALPVDESVFLTHMLDGGWWRLDDVLSRHVAARNAIQPHFEAAVPRVSRQSASLLAWAMQPDALGSRWLRVRDRAGAVVRGAYVAAAVYGFCEVNGREAGRRKALGWWADCELEEEREGVIAGLARALALTRELVVQLGPDAARAVNALTARGMETGIDAGVPPAISLAVPPNVRDRLANLLTLVSVDLESRDARFPVKTRVPQPLMNRALTRLRQHGSRELAMIADALTAALPAVNVVDESRATAFPLMRLLHLRMILEQPELQGALRWADRYIIPEVMLYVLGRDAVTYVPEIRVGAASDRRWRALWAESTAEAMSALVLEDRAALKLVTLSRIPETNDPTPDFRALTVGRERVVYECKGATDFETHRRQKRRARVQLGKDAGSATSWADEGHAYACCFFAAREGSSSTSRFSVEDPPFNFQELFGKERDVEAMRRHFAAVLAAADLRAAAGAALTGNGADEVPHEDFVVGDEKSDGVSAAFAGTYRDLGQVAKELGHPRSELFAGLKMFAGIDAGSFAALVKGQLPEWVWGNSEEAPAFQRLPLVGTTAKGVYSVLSDGAFLAFEMR